MMCRLYNPCYRKCRGVYSSAIPPPLQVENLSGEAFRDDTKDMKLKLMYELGILSQGGGGVK